MVGSKIKKYYIISLIVLVGLTSCDTNEPPSDNGHPNYKWQIDTIAYPGSFQTIMQTMWGNSINDLWIAGHNNRGYGKVWHYDGMEWKDVDPLPLGLIDSYSISNSISLNDESFICGDAIDILNDSTLTHSSLILSYNNVQWNVSELGGGGSLFSISGSKDGKLYATGWDLTLFSYENNNWVRKILNLDIPTYFETKNINSVLVDQNQSGYIVVYCYNTNPYGTYNYFFEENDSNWAKVDSFNTDTESRWGLNLWESQDGTIFSYNPRVYKYISNTWTGVFNDNQMITALGGTTKSNLFAAGYGVYHYNGNEWYEYKEFENQYGSKFGFARDILVIENYFFILFSNGPKSFVIKGHK